MSRKPPAQLSTLDLQRERARALQDFELLTVELQLARRQLSQLAGSTSMYDSEWLRARDAAAGKTASWRNLYGWIIRAEQQLRLRDAPLYPSDQPLARYSGDPRQPLQTQTPYSAPLRARRT